MRISWRCLWFLVWKHVEAKPMEVRKMSVISMKQLLEAGVHFGHQTRRWNPKMAEYIYTERNGIYIIDLQKSVGMVDAAYNAVKDISELHGYSMVLDRSTDSGIIYGSPKIDISNEVLKKLGYSR